MIYNSDMVPKCIPCSQGIIILGVPVGSLEWIRAELSKKLSVIRKLCDIIVKLNHPQVAFHLLRMCVSSKLTYFLRTVALDAMLPVAIELDSIVLNCAQRCGFVPDLDSLSDEERSVVGLPLKLGGMGLISCENIHEAAFVGSLTKALTILPSVLSNDLFDVCRSSFAECRDQGFGKIICMIERMRTFYPEEKKWSGCSLHEIVFAEDKLQRLFSRLSNRKIYLRVLAGWRTAGKLQAIAHFISAGSPWASIPLSTLPTEWGLRMAAVDFIAFLRFHAGLPLDNMTARLSSCGCAQPILDGYRRHALVCSKLRGSVIGRHDTVRNLVALMMKDAGLAGVFKEQMVFGLDNQRRADIISADGFKSGVRYAVDVAFATTTASSYCRLASFKNNRGVAARSYYNKKMKSAELASLHDYRLIPFVLETSGFMHPVAKGFIMSCARAAPYDARAFLLKWIRRLAICRAKSIAKLISVDWRRLLNLNMQNNEGLSISSLHGSGSLSGIDTLN